MQTSTWDGFTLTVGAGEDGVWAVYGCLHTSQIGVDTNFSEILIFVNGVEQASETSGYVVAGTGNGVSVTAHIVLNVGDTLQIKYYQQSSGTALYSVPDNRTRMSAFLISK